MKKRKLIDEQGRIFGVISAVDILAVLVVAVLAIMLYQRFAPAGDENAAGAPTGASTGEAKVECEFLISGLRSYGVDAIAVGDQLHSPSTGAVIGTVTAKRTEQYTQLTGTLDGRVVDMPMEEVYDLYLTVECDGTVADGRCYLKGTSELVKYMTVGFETPYVSTVGTLMAFSYEVSE